MLHLVNKPPLRTTTLKSVFETAAAGDLILLMEDGVHAVRTGAKTEMFLRDVLKKHSVYALTPDLKARGIHSVIDGVKTIGYDGFVDLAENHQVVTWT